MIQTLRKYWPAIAGSLVVSVPMLALVYISYLRLGLVFCSLVGYHPFSYTMWAAGVLLLIIAVKADRPIIKGNATGFLLVGLMAATIEGACLVGLSIFASTLTIAFLQWKSASYKLVAGFVTTMAGSFFFRSCFIKYSQFDFIIQSNISV